MPNRCCNRITLTGKKETIQKLVDAKFDFDVFFPTPPEMRSSPEDKWYEWRIKNWGTKWSPYDFVVKRHGVRGLSCIFSTAWTPPYAFFEKLLVAYPDLWLKDEWSEEGGYAGVWVGHGRSDASGNPNPEGPHIQHMEWEDLCLEDEVFSFQTQEEIDAMEAHLKAAKVAATTAPPSNTMQTGPVPKKVVVVKKGLGVPASSADAAVPAAPAGTP